MFRNFGFGDIPYDVQEEPNEKRDEIREKAEWVLKKFFINALGKPIKTPFYQRQLECLYESDYFSWVVSGSLNNLVDEGFLTVMTEDDIPEISSLLYVTNVKFYMNQQAVKTNDEIQKMKTKILNICKYINKYSVPAYNSVRGKHLEELVCSQLQIEQFEIKGTHTNKYNGIKWTDTEHNLDFIAKLKNSDLTIGVEVKNTLGLMETKEIDIKIDICNKLGIVPVFAVRWLKPYVNCIKEQNGFVWMFKTQIYPIGFERLVSELFKKFSARGLQYPISVSGHLPEKPVKIFRRWVETNKNNPPTVNPEHRCAKRR